MRLAADLLGSVLQAAIQGSLTERCKEDTPISKTLDSIYKQKKEMQIKNIIAKEKSTITLSEEVSSIDIPAEWRLVNLQSISQQITDGEHKTPARISRFEGYYLLSARNVTNEGVSLSDVDFVDKVEYDRISVRCNPQKGDILISCSGSVGRSCVIDDDNNYVMVRSAAMVRCINILPQYICIAIRSPFVQAQIEELKKKSVQANLFQSAIASLLIPLPPVEEQQRIVDRVNDLMPVIEEYKIIENRLTSIKKDFPGNLRSSIILAALQGKLTDQKEGDDSVDDLIQLLLAEKGEYRNKRKARAGVNIEGILEDELPFDIPSSWRFIRIIDMVKDIIAGGDKPKVFSKTKTEKCQIEVISNGEVNEGVFGYTDVATISERSLTVSGRGTIGYAVIRNEPYVPIVRLLVLIPLPHTNLEYLKYVLEGLLETGSGTAVKQLTVPMLSPKVIPLPPLAEQKRIVDTLNAILPACDKLSDEI